jgi:hypothetical protein
MSAAFEAMQLGLIKPIPGGSIERIRLAAKKAGHALDGLEVIGSEHSHDSAARAVALVAGGKAEALMKGSLHTDELIGPSFPDRRAFARRAGSAVASSWTCPAIDGQARECEEKGVHLETRRFAEGEYLSLRDEEGRLNTFKIDRMRPVVRNGERESGVARLPFLMFRISGTFAHRTQATCARRGLRGAADGGSLVP